MCQSAAAENALVRSGGCSCCRRLQKAAQKRTLLPSPLHLADQDCLQSVLFSQILLSCNIVRELRRQTGRQRQRLYPRECYGVVPAVDSSVLYSHSQPAQSTSHGQADKQSKCQTSK